MLAATEGQAEFEDLSTGFSQHSSAVQAACIWYGIYDTIHFRQQWNRILKPHESPAEAGYDAIDALLSNPDYPHRENARLASVSCYVHGTGDRVVPYLQSVEFFEHYLKLNDHKKIHLQLFENAPHGGPAFVNEANLTAVRQFFNKWLKDIPPSHLNSTYPLSYI